jgi:hypothetical protein
MHVACIGKCSIAKSTMKQDQDQHQHHSINNASIPSIPITLYQLESVSIELRIKYLFIIVCMQHQVMYSLYQLVVELVVVVVQSPHRTGSPAFGDDTTSREPQNCIDRDDLD